MQSQRTSSFGKKFTGSKYEAVLLFLLTVFRRFHGKWRENTIKNSEIFWHRGSGRQHSFGKIYTNDNKWLFTRCQKISLFLRAVSRHFPWKRRKTVRRKSDKKKWIMWVWQGGSDAEPTNKFFWQNRFGKQILLANNVLLAISFFWWQLRTNRRHQWRC